MTGLDSKNVEAGAKGGKCLLGEEEEEEEEAVTPSR
jgi:hypothetical protein